MHTLALRRTRAFTLVELLVVVAIAAILAAVAVPSLRDVMLRNRADTASNQFAAVLSLARSEAVKQGTPIGVCVGTVAAACPAGTPAAVNWGLGWVECCAPGTNNVAIQKGTPLTGALSVFGTTQSVVFDATGRLPLGPPLTFIFCPDGADVTKAYLVTVSTSGRTRVVAPVNGAAPVNDVGTPMQSCTAPS